jgi:RimJ/RimL family protein N-acetyltransferase
MAARAVVLGKSRRETRSCALYAVTKDTCELLGTTGFFMMDPVGTPGRKVELGINITNNEKWARKGYATEAIYNCVKYAFEKLESVEEMTIGTSSLNKQMRGWAENVADLEAKEIVDDSMWYSFTKKEW